MNLPSRFSLSQGGGYRPSMLGLEKLCSFNRSGAEAARLLKLHLNRPFDLRSSQSAGPGAAVKKVFGPGSPSMCVCGSRTEKNTRRAWRIGFLSFMKNAKKAIRFVGRPHTGTSMSSPSAGIPRTLRSVGPSRRVGPPKGVVIDSPCSHPTEVEVNTNLISRKSLFVAPPCLTVHWAD